MPGIQEDDRRVGGSAYVKTTRMTLPSVLLSPPAAERSAVRVPAEKRRKQAAREQQLERGKGSEKKGVGNVSGR